MPLIEGAQVNRNQARLPVVAMNDVGSKAQGSDGLENRTVEENKALAIVFKINAVAAVEPLAIEVSRLIDQEDRDG